MPNEKKPLEEKLPEGFEPRTGQKTYPESVEREPVSKLPEVAEGRFTATSEELAKLRKTIADASLAPGSAGKIDGPLVTEGRRSAASQLKDDPYDIVDPRVLEGEVVKAKGHNNESV